MADDIKLYIGIDVGGTSVKEGLFNENGELLGRVKGVRKKLSQDLGFLIPPVHIRDNLDLGPNFYRITLMGVTFGEAEIQPERDMAINPGQVFGEINGLKTVDPAFGLEAVWIAMAVDLILRGILCTLRWRSGRWRKYCGLA